MTEEEKEQLDGLKARNAELEAFLEKLMSGPRSIATVDAGPYNGFYRVREGDKALVLPVMTQNGIVPYIKVGKSVMVANNGIESVLPEELHVQEAIPEFTHIKWNEIGGIKSQIQQIREAVEIPLKYEHIYKEFNQTPLKGLMLYGPPGCGKTMIAKAIASFVLKNLAKVEPNSFVYLKGGEMLSKYVGEAEQNIKTLFDESRKHFTKTGHRSVIFIDEAEAIMPVRGSGISSDVDRTIVPTFLAEMDGFSDNNPFIILATNLPEKIDPAIQREGRIDLKIEVRRPDFADSSDIFRIHLSKTKLMGEVETLSNDASKLMWNLVPNIENRISGAYIANVVKRSIDKAIKRKILDKTTPGMVTYADIQETIKDISKEK